MNASLWGQDTLKASDVVAEPLASLGRVAVHTLWRTSLLSERTDLSVVQVVKGG